MKLFNRSYKVTIDDIEIEGGDVGTSRFGLDIKFKVVSTTKKDPNKIDLEVLNLNPDHRASLIKESGSQVAKKIRKPVPVVLEAGYAEGRGVIFRGELRNLVSKADEGGITRTIKLSGSDGGTNYNEARLDASFAPGTRVYDVVKACVDALGVGVGNLASVANLSIPDVGSTYPEGYACSGPAEKTLQAILFSAGFTWSVQKGVLQIKRNNKPVDEQVYYLSPETGLIGSPEPEVDATVLPNTTGKPNPPVAAKQTGLIKVRTLLLHELYPGAKVVLSTESFNGGYQITQVEHSGDTAGNDWYSDLLVRPY